MKENVYKADFCLVLFGSKTVDLSIGVSWRHALSDVGTARFWADLTQWCLSGILGNQSCRKAGHETAVRRSTRRPCPGAPVSVLKSGPCSAEPVTLEQCSGLARGPCSGQHYPLPLSSHRELAPSGLWDKGEPLLKWRPRCLWRCILLNLVPPDFPFNLRFTSLDACQSVRWSLFSHRRQRRWISEHSVVWVTNLVMLQPWTCL